MDTYLYGIVRRPAKRRPWGTGVGKPPQDIRLIAHGEIAAVVSDICARELESEGRALRRDLRAHEEVVRRAMDFGTVLPVSFGTVFDDDDGVVTHLLEPQAEELTSLLDRFDGLVEVTLKADFEEEAVIQRVLEQDAELQDWNASLAGGAYEDRIAFGQALAAAIEEQREIEAEQLLQKLDPLAEGVRLGKAGAGVAVLKASFLLDGRKLERFDQAIEKLAAERNGLMQFEYVGPLPPYSFINLNLAPANV